MFDILMSICYGPPIMTKDLDIPEVPERPKELNKNLKQRRVELEGKLEELSHLKVILNQRIRETETELRHIQALLDPTAKVGFERQLPFGRRVPKIDEEIYTRLFDEAIKDCGEEISATKIFEKVYAGIKNESAFLPQERSLKNKIRKSLRDLADARLIDLDVAASRGREKVYRRTTKDKVSLSDLNRENEFNISDTEEK